MDAAESTDRARVSRVMGAAAVRAEGTDEWEKNESLPMMATRWVL